MISTRGSLGGATVAALCLAAGTAAAPDARAQALRAAERREYRVESPHPYRSDAGPGPAWAATIDHPGATFIGVHFDRFELGPGDRVEVRSPSGAQRHVYTGRGRAEMGMFWASHIKGETAVVELFSPGRPDGAWGVSIDMYAAGFVDLGAEGGAPEAMGGTEAICGTKDTRNAICYDDGLGGDDDPAIYDGSRAVARLLVENTLLCTGWLVGPEGHLLTNNHCFDDPAVSDPPISAANTDYEFMSETGSCGTPNCQLCFPGTIWGGAATLVQRNASLDYAFVQLAGNPQNSYGWYTLDNRSAVVNERIYIPQHPGGRAKEIAVVSTDPSDASGFCEVSTITATPCTGGGADVGYQCDTEGGSSGSPVVAYSTHQVIALHHCADCPNRAVPIPPLVSSLGSALPACVFDPRPVLEYAGNGVDDSAGNSDGVPDPGEALVLPVDLRKCPFGAATSITATLSTADPLVTVTGPAAGWPDIPSGGVVTSLAPHFAVELDPTLPCGSLVDFDLSISSAEGAWLDTFSLRVGSGTAAHIVRPSTDTPFNIPDNSPTGITSTLAVPENLVIGDLNVAVDIQHTWIGDLIVELTSPSNTVVRLHDRTGGSTHDILTTYDSETPPDGPGTMADFDGESAAGNWRLKVSDNARFDTGTLVSWTLTLDGVPEFTCSPVSSDAGAIADLLLSHGAGGSVQLDWSPSCQGGDGDYGVYEGALGGFTTHAPRTCSTAGAASWALTPTAGNAYYLVVPSNGVREGSYGADSAGAERGQGPSACFAQQASCP